MLPGAVGRLLPALLVGLLLAALAPATWAHPRFRRRAYFGYPPPYDWRWGVSGYWGPGIDHPYYQPSIPFERRRGNAPRSRYERWMDEGYEAFRRGELKVARHRFEEARDLARERWGAGSNQAQNASQALANLRDPASESSPEPAATPDPDPVEELLPPVSVPEPLPKPSATVADTLQAIRDRLEAARRIRER